MIDDARYDGGRSWLERIGMLLLVVFLGVASLWTAGVVGFILSPRGWGAVAAGAFLLALLTLTVHPRTRDVAPWVAAGAVLLGAAVFLTRSPSNGRDWVAREARLPWAELQGDRLTVHNVRNFRYRTLEDFDAAWEERAYDLDRLETVDFVLARFPDLWWGAHTFVTFGFGDGNHLAVSIEARKEKGESYGVVAGLYRQFETIYVAGDERDLIGLRTHVQGDEVHLYRMHSTVEGRRAFLLDMVRRMNELRETPSFYNTLFDTCTTGLHEHLQRVRSDPTPLAYEVFVSGLSDRRAYDLGLIDTNASFEEARARSRIDPRRASLDAADFSRAIRAGR